MAAARGTTRVQIGSALWVAEERSSALQLVEAEAEEFTFSARNELDWLNEHMAEIFNENQLCVWRAIIWDLADGTLGASRRCSRLQGNFVERHREL
jgi:hypothetical protein